MKNHHLVDTISDIHASTSQSNPFNREKILANRHKSLDGKFEANKGRRRDVSRNILSADDRYYLRVIER